MQPPCLISFFHDTSSYNLFHYLLYYHDKRKVVEKHSHLFVYALNPNPQYTRCLVYIITKSMRYKYGSVCLVNLKQFFHTFTEKPVRIDMGARIQFFREVNLKILVWPFFFFFWQINQVHIMCVCYGLRSGNYFPVGNKCFSFLWTLFRIEGKGMWGISETF